MWSIRTPQSNMYKPVQQTFAPQNFSGGSAQYSSENSYLHSDTVTQSQSQFPFKNLTRYTQNDIQQTNCHLYKPNENVISSPFNDPLHVIADPGVHAFQELHKKQSFPCSISRCDNIQTTPTPGSVMSTSSLSTETPTPTATPTPTPEQPSQSHGCSIVDDGDHSLSQAPWYQALLPREIAFELLAREEIGSFLVRNSATHPGCCALSVRVSNKDNPVGITHYLIQKTNRGVRLKGLDKEWPSLQALVTHLTVIPEMLPCPLKLPQYTTNPIFTQFDPHLTANSSSNEMTKQRRNYNAKSSRTEMGVISTDLCSHHSQRTLHSVADLPCRPVPPTCATISHLGPTTTTNNNNNPQDQNSSSLSNNPIAQDRATVILPPSCYQVSKSSQVPNWLLSQITNEDKSQLSSSSKSSTNSPNQKPAKMDYNLQRWRQNSVDLATIITQSEYNAEDRSLCDVSNNNNNNNNNRKFSYTTNDLSQNNNNNNFILDYVEEDSDEDYQRLSDFSSILADLNFVNEKAVTSC